MKHVKVVKAVEIGGKLYTNPTHAAKRWVEQAAKSIVERQCADFRNPRYMRVWIWSQKYWVVSREGRIWRRVLPIFERLLR